MARKKGSKNYSLETKLEAIRLFEEEGFPYREITQRLGIRDPRRVKNWMRLYRKEGKAAFTKPRKKRARSKEEQLAERVAQLEMEVTLLKALALELGEELPEGLDIEPSTDTESNSK